MSKNTNDCPQDVSREIFKAASQDRPDRLTTYRRMEQGIDECLAGFIPRNWEISKISSEFGEPRYIIRSVVAFGTSGEIFYQLNDAQGKRPRHTDRGRFLCADIIQVNNKPEPVPDGKQVRIMLLCVSLTKKMQVR